MNDPTKTIRREMLATGQPQAELAEDKDQKWNTTELQADFEVKGFMAPFVVVKRRSDGKVGSLQFTRDEDGNRVYFGWQED